MCGIFGIKYIESDRSVDRRLVVESTDLMSHRGPDDAGYWVQGSLGLGHRRLSIIDLSPLGHQPMFNEDGQVGLVYNGEIYNYQELYGPLCERGHVFKSKTDSEVIIHAYEEWGINAVHKFNGMFSFGIWDQRTRTLMVVRDRLGIKPLYYYWDEKVFIFSSEIKPILNTGYVKPEINQSSLDAYFSVGYVPGPDTMFRSIQKVMPGHYLCLRDGSLADNEYWDFAGVEESALSPNDYQEQLEGMLRDSISKRLRSDVPLGVFLSGGLDSSAVVALMSDMVTEPINTFTVGYDMTRNFSEEPFADIVAKKFNTRHHVFKLESDNFFSSIEKLVEFAEEPIVEPAAIALYHISRLARQTATVLLSGEGSDELFAGYYLYHFMQKLDSVRNLIPFEMSGIGRVVSKLSSRSRLIKYGDWLGMPLEKRYQGTSGYLTDTIKRELYTADYYSGKGDYLDSTFASYFAKVAAKSDTLSKMLYVDTKTWLVDDLLVKADKMTMAASIELRVPFLDYRMVELAASFPSHTKLNAGNGKAILKSIMKSKLPDTIIDRTKIGFPVPVNDWFSNELLDSMRQVIRHSDLSQWINTEYIEKIMLRQSRGIEDNSKMIMALLVFAIWKKRFID